jgi:type IV pilus assembly protein PilA
MKSRKGILSNNEGFTLIELAVVVIIIGVLAAFAVPRFRNAVERSKAGESFNYLATTRAAQERYHARMGTYSDDMSKLDIKLSTPTYFSIGTIEAGKSGSLEDSWKLTLTRSGASAGYGAYTVAFTEDGFDKDPTASTIADADHEAINPMLGK